MVDLFVSPMAARRICFTHDGFSVCHGGLQIWFFSNSLLLGVYRMCRLLYWVRYPVFLIIFLACPIFARAESASLPKTQLTFYYSANNLGETEPGG